MFLLFLRPVPRLTVSIRVCGLWWVVVWLMGLLFENYIVDASIWDVHVLILLGVGGCVFHTAISYE